MPCYIRLGCRVREFARILIHLGKKKWIGREKGGQSRLEAYVLWNNGESRKGFRPVCRQGTGSKHSSAVLEAAIDTEFLSET